MKDLVEYNFVELAEEHARHVHSQLLVGGGEGLKHAVYDAMRVAIEWRVALDEKARQKAGKAKKGKHA